MEKYFVTMDHNGYIDNWSAIEFKGSIEVNASKEHFGLLSCVKVQSGIVILDEDKSNELKNEDKRTEVEKLKDENAELKKNQEIQNEAIADLGEIIASLGGGSNG